MKLHILPRAGNKKNETTRLRREGYIPAVLYVRGKSGDNLAVKSSEFNTFLRHVKSGHLPTTIFTLTDDKGHTRQAIIKDIQYHITTYDVIHLDFEELVPDQKINVKVPIECTGLADCV